MKDSFDYNLVNNNNDSSHSKFTIIQENSIVNVAFFMYTHIT